MTQRRRGLAALTLTLLSAAVLLPAPQAKRGLEWRHESGRGLALIHDGVPLWILHFDPKENWPYLHPLRLPGGPVMTGLSPKDHPWHRALWFSWKSIAGTNFWEFRDLKDPQSEPAGRTERSGPEDVETSERGADIGLDIEYRVGSDVLVREKRRIAIETPRPDGSYAIDWRGTFTAAGRDVELGKDTGYAGLFFRAAADWKQLRYLNSEGRAGMDVHQASAKWIDLSGVAAPAFGPMGVAIFDHPANPRFPNPWWRDRSSDDDGIGYIGTGLLFSGPMILEAGVPVTLRYRILVHKGWMRGADLEAEFRRFSATR